MSDSRARGLPPLLPMPRRAVRREGAFRATPDTPIVLGPGADDADHASACALQQALHAHAGVALPVETHARRDGLGPHLDLGRDAEGGEGYRIAVRPDRVELRGGGAAGLRYAAETLSQLVDGRGRIPACDVEDAPDLPVRGVMLDVSRGKVPSAETLRRIVDLCVRLKLNAFMLYVEHTFRFRRHPEIGAGSSPLTAQEVRELDAYAAARHVQLVPSLQSLGHMDHVLALPRYQHLAETPRRWTLSPAEPESYALLRDLYDEYLPNFRSRLFNANCDESFDLGLGRSRERSEELGPGGVFLEHVRRIRQLAGEHGKRTMIWADMVHAHPQRIGEIPRDVVLLDWWYEAECDYDRVARFAEAGLEFWVCPGTSSWNCLFPRIENAERNVEGWAGAARRHGAGGLLVTDWGDFGHYNLQGLSWLGYAWAAEQAWGGRADRRSFDRAFSARVFGDASGAAARLYRELGALHAAGFPVFNGSPLQFLFFDDLDAGFFCEGVQAPVLRRTLRGLARVRDRIERARARLAGDGLAWEELRWAADASIFAALKGLAGSQFVAWRRSPRILDARGRRRLARELAALAQRQAEIGRGLRRLWLARSRPSDLALTERRMAGSARSLRRAAAALAAGRPPAPPPEHPGFDVGSVLRAVTRSLAAAGGG